MTRHVLIIDSDPLGIQSKVLETCPQDTVDTVTGYGDALLYIQKQAQEGLFPDIVIMDILIPNEQTYAPNHFLRELECLVGQTNEKEECYDDHLRFSSPRLILYSDYPETELFAHAMNWHHRLPFPVSAYSKTDQNFFDDISTTHSCERRFWGYQDSIASLFPNMDLQKIISSISSPEFSNERILRAVAPEDILAFYVPQLQPTEVQTKASISFDCGVGIPMVGQAAFSLEGAKILKNKNPDLPVILIGEQNAQFVIEHAALLGGSAHFNGEVKEHFKEVARGRGLSMLNMPCQEGAPTECNVQNQKLHYHNNIVIQEGQTVTIDPQNGILYLEAVGFEPLIPPENSEALLQVIQD